MTTEPPRSANLPPGYDEEDPYEDEDLSTYPRWWRKNINIFQFHGMRPYRPPRFSDNEYTPPLISDLEEELNLDIQLRTIDPDRKKDWEILVDGTRIAAVARTRTSEGYSQYEIESDTFETLIRSHVNG